MALTEDTIVDSIDVLPDGQIQVRRADRIFRDGVEISKSYHRHVVSPGDDLSKEDQREVEYNFVNLYNHLNVLSNTLPKEKAE